MENRSGSHDGFVCLFDLFTAPHRHVRLSEHYLAGGRLGLASHVDHVSALAHVQLFSFVLRIERLEHTSFCVAHQDALVESSCLRHADANHTPAGIDREAFGRKRRGDGISLLE